MDWRSLLTPRKIILALFLVWIVFRIYDVMFSSGKILERVVSQKSYQLDIAQEKIPIEMFIEPSMIPTDSATVHLMDINKTLAKMHHTTIILDNVLSKNGEIHFSFTMKQQMNVFKGEFLHNNLFNGKGGVSYSTPLPIELIDLDGNMIPLGGTGIGPDSDFSFGISYEDRNRVTDGFYVRYNGLFLYRYSLF